MAEVGREPCSRGSRGGGSLGEGGCGVVGDHEPRVDAGAWAQEGRQSLGAFGIEHTADPALRDGPDLCGGDCEKVQDEGERLPVEVAQRSRRARREHDGVVRDGVELAAGYLRGVIRVSLAAP
jgi:hypothetical protein